MGISLPQNRKKKSLMGAIAAGILAGAATMFIPTSVLETFTGATGLSELVPATGAPLGDKARALIAFGTGALTLAVATMLLLRKEDVAEEPEAAPVQQQAESSEEASSLSDRLAGLKDRLPQIKLPKMPWVKGENEVRDLSDLPSIRSADAHPDAPTRRPLLATKDLPLEAGAPKEICTPPSAAIGEEEALAEEGDIEEIIPVLQVETESEAAPVEAEAVETEDTASEAPTRPDAPALQAEPVEADVSAPEPVSEEEALPDMISRFEAAIERRKSQLGKLAELDENTAPVEDAADANDLGEPDLEADATAPANKRPPLEAVPDTSGEDDEEMDVALNAALETLHRMNAQAR